MFEQSSRWIRRFIIEAGLQPALWPMVLTGNPVTDAGPDVAIGTVRISPQMGTAWGALRCLAVPIVAPVGSANFAYRLSVTWDNGVVTALPSVGLSVVSFTSSVTSALATAGALFYRDTTWGFRTSPTTALFDTGVSADVGGVLSVALYPTTAPGNPLVFRVVSGFISPS